MANRTVKDAKSIKGTNPQYLIEKIIRSRIYDSKYWKEECFALTAELLVDKAMELRFIGGVFGGNIKPTPFLCLILKMLQIQPEKEIIVEFIKNEEFKYVRVLGAYYMRLTGSSLDCYNYLEPLLNDYRKIRRQNREGVFELVHVDEFVDDLLREERVCDVILPRLQKRNILEESNQMQPRTSVLEEDEDDDDEDMELEQTKVVITEKKKKESKSSSKLTSKSTHKGDREDRRRRRSPSSDSDSGDDLNQKRRSDRDNERERKGERPYEPRSHRQDQRKHIEPNYNRRESDRDRGVDRDRKDRTRPKEREKERNDRGDHGKSRDVEKDRHHHREKDRESDRHRSSRRHDY